MSIKQKQIIGDNSQGIQTQELNLMNIIQIYSKEFDIEKVLFELFSQQAKVDKVNLIQAREIFPINLDPPVLPEKVSKRNKIIQNSIELLEKNSYLHIVGEKGSGKTILALLINERFSGRHLWITFRDIKKEFHDLYFISAFSNFSNKEMPNTNIAAYFNEELSNLPNGSILILDDLPELSENFQLSQKLINLASNCKKHKVSLITTSYFDLPESFKSSIGKNNFQIFKSPPFDITETKELSLFYNPPEKMITDELVVFIIGLTKGNPILLNALFRPVFDSNRQIQANTIELKSIFSRKI